MSHHVRYNDVTGIFLDGTQIAKDSLGRVISINNGFFAPGTVVTNTGSVYNGSTPLLSVQANNLTTTTHLLQFVVCDAYDAAYGKIRDGIFCLY